ncbi:LysR substrate-binding domain-containing protein [Hoeflea alexandrii]|jgi:LysR family hydrogen peroxide-inducible transcriptional activator
MSLIDFLYEVALSYRPSHRQLQYFVAVAQKGHFLEAARACNVSQPTLSTQLKLLEDQLGVVLIERGGATAVPTAAGARLLPLARTILSGLDEFVEMASVDADNLGGLVRLGVAPTFGPYFLPHYLPQLHRLYPALEIYIREDRPNTLESDLRDGKLDCIMTPMPLATEGFDAMPFCVEKIFLGVPNEHPIADRRSIGTTDLAGEKLLTLGRGHRLFEQVLRLCDVSGAQMRSDYEGTSLDALRQMVSIGMGLSLFPSAYVSSEFERETGITLFELSDLPLDRQIGLAWRRNSVRSDHFRLLCEEARKAVSMMSVKGMTTA